MNATHDTLLVKPLGLRGYEPVWREMQDFTARRGQHSQDQLWLVEHPPVFTLGLNGKPEHVLDSGGIPVLNVDRGGQVTYHGPGQLVIYTLLDIQRRQLGVRELVRSLEQAIINLLASHHIAARGRADAPGVYVHESKIAALGLRIKRGRSYHGLAFNIHMDLAPFARINPCGYADMPVTQLHDLGVTTPFNEIRGQLVQQLASILGYNNVLYSQATPSHEQTD